jgi:hypothetical protein
MENPQLYIYIIYIYMYNIYIYGLFTSLPVEVPNVCSFPNKNGTQCVDPQNAKASSASMARASYIGTPWVPRAMRSRRASRGPAEA